MADRLVYKEIDNEVVYRVVGGLIPKGWSKKPFGLLEKHEKPDSYEIRPEHGRSQRRQPEAGRSR